MTQAGRFLTLCGFAGWLLGAAGSSPADTPAAPVGKSIPQPAARVGPYRVVVDRITQNRNLTLDYNAGGRDAGGVRLQRTVQVQVGVIADDKTAAGALATFQIKAVTVSRNGRAMELPYYGGPLETPNDPAVVRAYLYVPTLPASAGELRSIDGEIVSYDHTVPMEIDVPLDGTVPRTVEKNGIKVTLREWTADGASVRVALWVEAPANTVIVNTTTDGSYGLSLLNADQRAAPPGAGTMIQVRGNQAEYRMTYHSLQGTASALRVRFLHRGGNRKVYPFKVEHVPVPNHPGR